MNLSLKEDGPFDPKKVFEALLGDGLLVRDVSSYPMLEKALRVSCYITFNKYVI